MDLLLNTRKPLTDFTMPLLRPGVVTPVFQPIMDLAGQRHRIIALEGLARGPQFTALESPTALFAAARRAGQVAQLDRLCIATALEAARQLPPDVDLFLNVHPATLCQDCGFPAFLANEAAQAGIAPQRITIELLEHARVSQCECRQLRATIQVLRGLGVRLAVDDVSGAPEDVRRVLSLKPEFLKMDAHVVRGARSDLRLRALLHAIAEEAAAAGAQVIAEGIEELRDLDAVSSAGITLAQGYLLGRPSPVAEFAETMIPASLAG
jgi:EAL domain-containing protein (putative c-di-GMP-specific phosphodiesterase class I)